MVKQNKVGDYLGFHGVVSAILGYILGLIAVLCLVLWSGLVHWARPVPGKARRRIEKANGAFGPPPRPAQGEAQTPWLLIVVAPDLPFFST